MINYLVTRGYEDTFKPFVEEWAPRLEGLVNVINYEDLRSMREFPPGAVIFSDLERVHPTELQFVVEVKRRIDDGSRVILNDPAVTLRRFDLLTAMASEGLNPHLVYRLASRSGVERYPVFVRSEREHTGPITGLVDNEEQLTFEIAKLLIRGRDPDDLMIVEYCDTADPSGVFTKFGAFIVGSVVIARHLQRDTQWVVKGDAGMEGRLQDELTYIRTNPHREQLRAAASCAGVDYGRVDYSMLGDRVVTWEINTNPLIVRPRATEPKEYWPKQDIVLTQLEENLLAVVDRSRGSVPTTLWGRENGRPRMADSRPIPAIQRFRGWGRQHLKWARPVMPAVDRLVEPFSESILRRFGR